MTKNDNKLQQSLSDVVEETTTDESPISETFEAELANMEAKNEVVAEAEPSTSLAASLGDLEFVDDTEFSGLDFDAIVNQNLDQITKSGVSVTCLQSAYSAEIGPINMRIKSAITTSKVSAYEYNQKLFAAIYSSINKMSFPKPGFDVWLKITSYLDLEILYFGMYSKTYVNDSQFDVTCGKCETKLKATINPNSVIQIKDNEVFNRISELMKIIKTPADLKEHSLISRSYRKMLGSSKFVIDVKIPSLHDFLEVIKSYGNAVNEDVKNAVGTLLYMKSLAIPHPSQPNKYIKVTSPETVIRLLNTLPDNDIEELDSFIKEKVEKYQIEFKIPEFSCSNCGNQIGPLPLDMENLVFMKAGRRV